MIKTIKEIWARKPFQDDPAYGPGGFLDNGSYIGNFRSMIIGFLGVFVIRYFDLWGIRLYSLWGTILHITPGKMRFHTIAGLWLGGIGMLTSFILCWRIYKARQAMRDYDFDAAYHKSDAEVAERMKERATQLKRRGIKSDLMQLDSSTFAQRLQQLIRRYPLLHDILWGWPFLLGFSLIFFGKTLDGSSAAVLSSYFQYPSLEFFKPGITPVAAFNGVLIGGVAYLINHAISKLSVIRLPMKMLFNLIVGTTAVLAWYLLTSKMGAPI